MVSKFAFRFRDGGLFLVVAALLAALAGCGGGSGETPRTGSFAFRVQWPERTRIVPVAANSVRVHLAGRDINNELVTKDVLLVRPAAGGVSEATFDKLLPEPINVDAKAFPDADGTGTIQGVTTLLPTIVRGKTTTVSANFTTTVTSVKAESPVGSLAPGQTAQTVFTAFDSKGDVVLVAGQTVRWSSSDTAVATVSAGLITAIAPGKAIITARDSESDQSSATTILVTAPPVQTHVFAVVSASRFPGFALREYTPAGEVVRDVPLPHQDYFGASRPPVLVNRDGKVLTLTNPTVCSQSSHIIAAAK